MRQMIPADTVARLVHDVEEFAPAWDELASRTGASAFAHPGWVLAWSNAFSAPERLKLVGVWRDEALVAALPFEVHWRSAVSPTNWHTPVYTSVHADLAAARAAVAALLSTSAPHVRLAFVAQHDPLVDLVAARSDHHLTTRVLQRSPYVALDGTWDSYLVGRSRNLRGDIRRRLRHAAEHGPVSLDLRDGTTDLERSLDEGFQLEGSGWKRQAGSAIASSERTRSFYSSVARWAAARGWLSLAFLRIGERAIAFQYGIVASNTYYFLKGGYDPRLSNLSPGKLLHSLMIERAFADGLEPLRLPRGG